MTGTDREVYLRSEQQPHKHSLHKTVSAERGHGLSAGVSYFTVINKNNLHKKALFEFTIEVNMYYRQVLRCLRWREKINNVTTFQNIIYIILIL